MLVDIHRYRCFASDSIIETCSPSSALHPYLTNYGTLWKSLFFCILIPNWWLRVVASITYDSVVGALIHGDSPIGVLEMWKSRTLRGETWVLMGQVASVTVPEPGPQLNDTLQISRHTPFYPPKSDQS